MRQPVLGRDIPDEVLSAGSRRSRPRRADARPRPRPGRRPRCRLSRAQRRRCTTSWRRSGRSWRSCSRLRDEGRLLGIVTAKRRETVQLAFDRLPGLEESFPSWSRPTTRSGTSLLPIRSSRPSTGSESTPAGTAYVGDSPFDIRAAKAAGVFSIAVAWGGIHTGRGARARGARRVRRHAEELLPSSDTSARAAELRELLSRALVRATTSGRPGRSPTPSTTGSTTSWSRSRSEHPELVAPTRRRNASARPHRTGSRRCGTSSRWARSRR